MTPAPAQEAHVEALVEGANEPTLDPLRAALPARRALIEAETPGPWAAAPCQKGFDACRHIVAPGELAGEATDSNVDDALLVVAMHAAFARDTGALEAVLERHAPEFLDHQCDHEHCSPVCKDDDWAVWPCPDARAALTALGVEGC